MAGLFLCSRRQPFSQSECLAAQERFEEAEPLLAESHPVLLERRGVGDRRALQAVARVVALYERWGRSEEAERFRRLIPERS